MKIEKCGKATNNLRKQENPAAKKQSKPFNLILQEAIRRQKND